MLTREIHIRPARQQDIDTLVLLLGSLFALEADFRFDPVRQQAGLSRLIASDRDLILVAEDQGRVVGMCSGQTVISTAEGGPALLVEDVVVAADRRGEGIGTRLLENLAGWAAGRGISRLQLLADRNNHEALNFYTKRGWRTTQLICLRTYTGVGGGEPDRRS